MASYECNNKNHEYVNVHNPFHKKEDDNLIYCVKIDRLPFVYKKYCKKCFEFEGHIHTYNHVCTICLKRMNKNCFYDKNGLCEYCFDCLKLSPDEVWPYDSSPEMIEEIKDILEDQSKTQENSKDLGFTLFEIVDLIEEYRGVYQLKLWNDKIHDVIKNVNYDRQEYLKKEKIKKDHEKYTLMTKIEDKLLQFIPKLSRIEAHYASRKIDTSNLKSSQIDDIHDAESFIDWIINIKPIH